MGSLGAKRHANPGGVTVSPHFALPEWRDHPTPRPRCARSTHERATLVSDPPGEGKQPDRAVLEFNIVVPQPRVPIPRNLILPAIKFSLRPLDRVALHNVDMLPSDTAGRWTSHSLRVSSLRIRHRGPRLAGGRARRLTPFSKTVRDQQ
ncbi:hypothetical protein ABIE71_002902 [Bradyrhizobium diazoefficiens]